MELPQLLLARAVRAAGPGTNQEGIEEGWRKWVVDQPSWMQDTMMHSVMSYALLLAEGSPAAWK